MVKFMGMFTNRDKILVERIATVFNIESRKLLTETMSWIYFEVNGRDILMAVRSLANFISQKRIEAMDSDVIVTLMPGLKGIRLRPILLSQSEWLEIVDELSIYIEDLDNYLGTIDSKYNGSTTWLLEEGLAVGYFGSESISVQNPTTITKDISWRPAFEMIIDTNKKGTK